ncbi:MAG: FAD-dependent oxidoreductase [Candidatus Methanoperedens sp.]|nr:FAD-dependent oxidoreductase [Candidatus Methanoperedens sp.]
MRFETAVTQKIQQTPDVISIRFNRPEGFDFTAGQYMFIKLKSGGKQLEKHFTISSSPTELDYIAMTKKLTGHEFANALAALKEGDKVTINAPFGDFAFNGEYDKIGMLSGGIGITPLRSMIRYCSDKQLGTNIVLLHSNSSENDIVFKNEFEEMQRQNKNLKVVNTITHPGKEWKGLTGRIDKEMVQKEIPDYMERVFYICGPPKMVDAMVSILKEMNIPGEQIKQEYFPGY